MACLSGLFFNRPCWQIYWEQPSPCALHVKAVTINGQGWWTFWKRYLFWENVLKTRPNFAGFFIFFQTRLVFVDLLKGLFFKISFCHNQSKTSSVYKLGVRKSDTGSTSLLLTKKRKESIKQNRKEALHPHLKDKVCKMTSHVVLQRTKSRQISSRRQLSCWGDVPKGTWEFSS